MSAKRKIYCTFALIILISLYKTNVFSATEYNPGAPHSTPTNSYTNKKIKPSPKGVDEIQEAEDKALSQPYPSLPFPSVFSGSVLEEDSHLKSNNTSEAPSHSKSSLAPSHSKSSLAPSHSKSSFSSESRATQDGLILSVFKASLEAIDPPDSSPAAIAKFVNTILDTVAGVKQSGISDEAIGIALNEIAEKFSDHDYFSIDRFNGTLNIAQQEAGNARLMRNWEKWYTYKMLAYFYKREAMTKEDIDVIAASMRSDNTDIYETSQQLHDQMRYALGKPFYTKKCNFVQTVYAELTARVPSFSTFMDSLG